MSVTFAAYAESPESPGYYDALAWGPNLTATNAELVLRSLGYEAETIARNELEPAELGGRLALALVVGGELADDGIPDIACGRMITCGIPPGYLAARYAELAELCEQAIVAGAEYVGWA